MPSIPYSNALFAAGTEFWKYPKWEERTNIAIPPFSPEATPQNTGLNVREISAVKAFSERIHNIKPLAKLIEALSNKRDNDADGRSAWETWIKRNFDSWHIVQDVEAVLVAEGRHPRQLIGQQGFGSKVPSMDDAGVSEVFSVIAENLFGEDAFRDIHVPRPIVKDELNRLISTILAHVWNNMRKRVASQYERLQSGKEEAHAWFETLNNIQQGKRMKKSDIQQWFKRVDRLRVLATSFYDTAALEELDRQIERMNWAHKVLTGTHSPVVNKGLSKSLRDALTYMATHDDVELIKVQLLDHIEQHKAVHQEPMVLDFDHHDPVEWTEGVEHLQTKTEDELYNLLGFKDNRIPFLVLETDAEPDVVLNSPIDIDEHPEDAAPPAQDVAKEPFSLRWHQLVGLTKMVESALTSSPILLMDDVGIGKTLQVIALFATLAYYRSYHSQTNKYPGIWGTHEWTNFAGEKATLPDYPFLIVVPPLLVNQAAAECDRFLEKGSFDIIKYISGYKTHKDIWAELDKRSHNAPHMRIYIAASSAVQADSSFVHLPSIGTRQARPAAMANKVEASTIFGRHFLAIAVDEAHAFRLANKFYTAVRALRQNSDIFVAMSATPIETRPSDLWNIGKAIGLHGFKDGEETDNELKMMNREIARAKREDKKLLSGVEEESRSALRRVFQGTKDEGAVSAVQDTVDQTYWRVNAKWMKVIRAKYQGSVIRRTGSSLDINGNPISGLPPYDEHICILKLYRHEYAALDTLAEKALDGESFAKRFSSEKFYVDIRRCLLHPCFADVYNMSLIEQYSAYRLVPSCKLESIMEIIKYHLATDAAPGLKLSRQRPPEIFLTDMEDRSRTPSPSPSRPTSLRPSPQPEHQTQQSCAGSIPGTKPDKIVIYSYFVSSFGLIEMVFKHHNIKYVAIHGSSRQQERIANLEAFKNSGRDGPRVLLLSSVGAIGLNIAFANILIIVDVLWSVMNDQQLIGRVWRYPQSKKVHIYRLIGGGSPDILLNNLSFSKGFLQETFMNIGDTLRKALERRDSDEVGLAEGNDTEPTKAAAAPSKASKRKGKGKAQAKNGGNSETSKRSEIATQPKKGKAKAKAKEIPLATQQNVQPISQPPADPLPHVPPQSETLLTHESAQFASQSNAGPSSLIPDRGHVLVFPASPKTIQDLPLNLLDLEVALPGYDAPPIDAEDGTLEDEIARLALSDPPDFVAFLRSHIKIIDTHRRSISQQEHAALWDQLKKRNQMVHWYLKHYMALEDPKAQAHGEAEFEVDPAFAHFDHMDIDPYEEPTAAEAGGKCAADRASSPLSSLAPSPPPEMPSKSVTPSESSASTHSKRSRERSPESCGPFQRRKTDTQARATGSVKVTYKRPSARSRPARDEQFLAPEGHNPRPRSKQPKSRAFIDDDSESISDLSKGAKGGGKGGKGKGRAL